MTAYVLAAAMAILKEMMTEIHDVMAVTVHRALEIPHLLLFAEVGSGALLLNLTDIVSVKYLKVSKRDRKMRP